MPPSKYNPLTDELLLSEIIPRVEKGLSLKKACLLANTSYATLEIAITGEHPKKPHWRDIISGARAACEEFWLDVLRDPKVTNPQAKAAQIMLGAIAPKRYREQRQEPQQGMIVNFIQGESGEIVHTEVIQPKVKRGKPLALKAVDVPPADGPNRTD